MKPVSSSLFGGMVACALIQPASAADTAKFREKVVYSFCGSQNCTDGGNPRASLTDVNGTLYGTTALGGVYGAGMVFAFDRKTSKETAVYSFCAEKQGDYCLDGQVPEAGLISVNGTLYGTTTFGGNEGCDSQGCGTVFSLDAGTGTEVVLHNFGGGTDGAVPYAGVISVKSILYGTTFDGGGSCNCGTVFSVDPATGSEAVLHAFTGGADGEEPFAGVTYLDGKLYGTVRMGGYYGAGAIFSFDLKDGKEKLVYSFCPQFGCPDGGYPETGLIEANGVLYGTTNGGGATAACPTGYYPPGCGTVYSFDPKAGTEKILFAFCNQSNCTDGWAPEGSLIDVNGILYGTTYLGGQPAGCETTPGCGTVFSVDPDTGTQSVLWSFATGKGVDGTQPVSGLVAVKGTLYGTTLFGGANGEGIVFALKQKR